MQVYGTEQTKEQEHHPHGGIALRHSRGVHRRRGVHGGHVDARYGRRACRNLLDSRFVPRRERHARPGSAGTEVTAAFGPPDGKVAGSAGCNGYGGDYQLDGTSLSVSSLVQTLKLCTEPEGIMEQEARFIDLLGSAAECRIENDRLVITDAAGATTLIFVEEDAPTGLAGNTWWTLVSLAGENGTQTPVLDGTGVTVTFSAEGSLGGSAGCNHYSADYTVDGATLTIKPAVRTEMYCNEPPGIMDQEDRYLALLTDVASYRMEANRLILADSDGTDLLVFEKAAQTPNLPLVGTDWVLESYSTNGDAISSVIVGTKVTANFAADGNVGGNAGCNHYGGEYSLDGANLSVSSLFSTLMYCETPGVMEQEAAFMSTSRTSPPTGRKATA